MKICVAGLWHLGSVTAACLASLGHRVIAFDFDAFVIVNLNKGALPVSEPGLDGLIAAGMSAGSLNFTATPAEIGEIDILWCTYDTPVDDDDKSNTTWVIEQLDRLLPSIRKNTLVLISSQLPVGSVRQLEQAHSLSTPLLSSVLVSNNEHKRWAQKKLLSFFGELRGMSIAVWGLTYKPGTDTLRRSLMVEFCDWLIDRGANVKVHDPAARALPEHWNGKVVRYDDPGDAARSAQALVIGTQWPVYKDVARLCLSEGSINLLVLDADRFLNDIASLNPRLRYVAVGTPDPVKKTS